MAAGTGHLGPTVFRSTDLGRDVERGDRAAGVRTPATGSSAACATVFWLTPGPRRRAGRLVRGRLAAGPVPHRGRRRHVGAGRRLERPPDVGDLGGVARGEHARRLDAALGHRRSARRRAPLHRPVGRRRVREHRRRQRLGAAQRRASRPTSSPIRTPSSATTRTACGCTRRCPTGCTSRTTAASTAWSGPRRRWERIGDNMPRDVGDIGFPIELHPRDPDTAWVFPMDGTDVWPRTSPDGRPAVYVTRDAGAIVDAPGRRACPSGRGSR